MKNLITALFILLSTPIFANTYFCNQDFESLPIQQGGRVKPLKVHANESIKQLTGKSKIGEYSSVMAYCLLSIKSLQLPVEIKAMARIDHVDVQKFLGLDTSIHEMSFDDLVLKETEIRQEMMKQKFDTSYKKSLTTLFNSIFLYKEITNGENWLLAEENGNNQVWTPLVLFLNENKIKDKNTGDMNAAIKSVIMESKDYYLKTHSDKYLIELKYIKLHLVEIALITTLIALALLVLVKNPIPALITSGLVVVIQTAILVFRIYISGRAPITNMYETVLFSGYGGLVLAMIIGHFKKQTVYVYMGLAYNVCTLMMLNFANGMLSASISPLVPVLRDNFWLSTHVTTIILSYGALALSWILSNTILIKRKLGKISAKEEIFNSEIIYTTLKWGTTLLAAGIILGGVWADYSWGRFWGWDPKETWSLIVLCIYMAILHGRYTTWIKPDRFITVTAAAFMSVMMAWFGVNYILASGLHSYGFSEGGALFLGSFFAIQILLIIFTLKPKKA